MRKATTTLLVLAALLLGGSPAFGHCQIPCGIYDDMMRIEMMRENVTTIERSIRGLADHAGKATALDANQTARWVINKEEHADQITDIVTAYFLQQRLKDPGADDEKARQAYVDQLTTLHGILVATMQVKQTADAAKAAELRTLIDRFATLYFGPEAKEHAEAKH